MKIDVSFRGIRRLINRRIFIILLILGQIVLTALILYRATWLRGVLIVFSVVTALHLLIRRDKSAFKLSLIFLILLFPVFGGAFYWIFHTQTYSIGYRKRLAGVEKNSHDALELSEDRTNDAAHALPSVQ